MFLLDTNVITELRKAKSGRADRNVITWAASVAPGSLFLSAMTILELEVGVLRMERRDRIQGALLRSWLDLQVMTAFEHRVLNVDPAVALRCAGLHVPNPSSERDSLIAATALVHGMTVVTRNESHFKVGGVSTLNPWIGV